MMSTIKTASPTVNPVPIAGRIAAPITNIDVKNEGIKKHIKMKISRYSIINSRAN